ncbi:MAG: hypothetical protein QOI41_6726 [Myxococcales bacterium]|nr:hypothetical protein [Myxococcales bacterium]
MRYPAALAVVVVSAVVAPSCKPDFGERESFVDRTQVIAVRIDPPEAKPGETVTTSLLVISPNGPVDAPPASWAFCATPKLLTENGAVSAACLANGVVPIGDARGGVSATLPMSGCFDFGPEVQSAEVRPRDPDVTGGFFLPIRARIAGDAGDALIAFGFARLVCNLANAPGEIAAQFRAQYKRNVNPTLLPVEGHLEGATDLVALDAIPRGARVILRASWSAGDAESYALFDVLNQVIVTRRESLRVSWFATAGSYAQDRSGRIEDEPETFSVNTWTAPNEARVSHLSLVLRDARGGMDFTSIAVTTR